MIKTQEETYKSSLFIKMNESIKNQTKSKGCNTCDSVYHYWFETFILFLTIYDGIMIPYELAVQHVEIVSQGRRYILFIDTTVDLFFTIDLVHNFFKPYVNQSGITVYRVKKIAKKYLSSWFIFDLISVIPFYHLAHLGQTDDTKDIAYYQFISALRLLRLFRLRRLLNLMHLYGELKNLIRVVMTSIFMFMVVHWNGCFFYKLINIERDIYMKEGN